jgi:hypothetical protein
MNAAIQRMGTDFGALTQRFSEYTGQRNINPLLCNIQAERILPWQRILVTVLCLLSNQSVAMEA